jgi:hypothetical protein
MRRIFCSLISYKTSAEYYALRWFYTYVLSASLTLSTSVSDEPPPFAFSLRCRLRPMVALNEVFALAAIARTVMPGLSKGQMI